MNSPDKQWWIEQAGEYVLGTLDDAEWLAFHKAMQHNEEAQRLVAEWEQAFQPLADSLDPVEPNPEVWRSIVQRLNALEIKTPPSAKGGTDVAAMDGLATVHRTQEEKAATVVDLSDQLVKQKRLQRAVSRWQVFAGFATAASLLMAAFVWFSYTGVMSTRKVPNVVAVSEFNTISIIRDEQSLPLWVVDAALDEGLLRVTAVAPPEIDSSNDYQLWLVKPDDAGVQSIGLMPAIADQSFLLRIDAVDEKPAAFAVSLEPAGGSALAVPSGPVLFSGELRSLGI